MDWFRTAGCFPDTGWQAAPSCMGNVPLQSAVAKLQFIPRNPIRTKAQLRHREHKQLDTPRICRTWQIAGSKQEYGAQANRKYIGLLLFDSGDFGHNGVYRQWNQPTINARRLWKRRLTHRPCRLPRACMTGLNTMCLPSRRAADIP